MRRIIATTAGAVALAAAGAFAAVALAGGGGSTHVTICHHTGRAVPHEWIRISPDVHGVVNGHGQPNHNYAEDIIPAIPSVGFPGLNLDERIGLDLEPDPSGPYTGAEILAAGCVAPAASTTTTTQTRTETTATTATVPASTVTTTVPATTTVQTTTTTTTASPPTRKPRKASKPPTRTARPATPITTTPSFTG